MHHLHHCYAFNHINFIRYICIQTEIFTIFTRLKLLRSSSKWIYLCVYIFFTLDHMLMTSIWFNFVFIEWVVYGVTLKNSNSNRKRFFFLIHTIRIMIDAHEQKKSSAQSKISSMNIYCVRNFLPYAVFSLSRSLKAFSIAATQRKRFAIIYDLMCLMEQVT